MPEGHQKHVRVAGRPAVVAGVVLLLAVAFGLVDAAQAYLRASMQGRPYSLGMALLDGMPSWLLLAVLSPAVVAMARRVRLDSSARTAAMMAHLVAAASFAVVHQTTVALVNLWRFEDARLTPLMWKFLTLYFAIDFLIYWAIVGECYAVDYARELRRREIAASQLQASLSQARLEVLRAQLNPHFLFNTLNAISVLALKGESDNVVRTLSLLGELLRLSLDSTLPQEVPLSRELHFMDRYLEIQRVRFPNRLIVERRIDPAALDALVPSLILQPLVENAVVHGVSTLRGAGQIRIAARREDGRIVLDVHDSGPGFANGEAMEGIGLRNTRARLQQLYAADHQFRYGTDDSGAWVAIELPYRREGSDRGQTGVRP
jgi:two-component system LytT family sensor kinase